MPQLATDEAELNARSRVRGRCFRLEAARYILALAKESPCI